MQLCVPRKNSEVQKVAGSQCSTSADEIPPTTRSNSLPGIGGNAGLQGSTQSDVPNRSWLLRAFCGVPSTSAFGANPSTEFRVVPPKLNGSSAGGSSGESVSSTSSQINSPKNLKKSRTEPYSVLLNTLDFARFVYGPDSPETREELPSPQSHLASFPSSPALTVTKDDENDDMPNDFSQCNDDLQPCNDEINLAGGTGDMRKAVCLPPRGLPRQHLGRMCSLSRRRARPGAPSASSFSPGYSYCSSPTVELPSSPRALRVLCSHPESTSPFNSPPSASSLQPSTTASSTPRSILRPSENVTTPAPLDPAKEAKDTIGKTRNLSSMKNDTDSRSSVPTLLVRAKLQSSSPPIHSSLSNRLPRPVVVIPGGGIYYFWKVGFVLYLRRHFDLTTSVFIGASAGALASAVVCCCRPADVTRASRLAIRMAMQNKAWERHFFLSGILHKVAKAWLEKVIPVDVDLEDLKRRLCVVVCRVSRVRLEGMCNFTSRDDLIECLLGSIHIPLYSNGRAGISVRGNLCCDGSFGSNIIDVFLNDTPPSKYILIKCSETDYYTPIGRRECLRAHRPETLCDFVRRGFAYAKLLHKDGRLIALNGYETASPGTYDTSEDPFLDANRLHDNSLDL